jgi:hypothetical protein
METSIIAGAATPAICVLTVGKYPFKTKQQGSVDSEFNFLVGFLSRLMAYSRDPMSSCTGIRIAMQFGLLQPDVTRQACGRKQHGPN